MNLAGMGKSRAFFLRPQRVFIYDRRMKKWGIILVLVGACVGIVCAAYSLHHYVAVMHNTQDAPAFCAINDTFNCDAVAASSYAAWKSVPLAGIGLLFFAVQLLLALWALWDRAGQAGAATVGAGLGLFGLLPSAYLIYVMAVVLGAYCIPCLGMDVSQALILIGWFGSGLVRWKALRERTEYLRPATAVLVLGAVGGLLLVNLGDSAASASGKPSPALLAQAIAAWQRQPAQNFSITPEHFPMKGNPDAPITVVEFSDFQCPFCKLAAKTLWPALNEYRQQIRFVFVNFPMDNSCNTKLQQPMHQSACVAARGGICAQQLGKFWQYHDALFADQKAINREMVVAQAKALGADPAAFAACLDAPETEQILQQHLALGQQVQLPGTPAIFINGRFVKVWQSRDFLRAAIDASKK